MTAAAEESQDCRAGAASAVGLGPTQMHYMAAYSAPELRTFHCERVRKMPLSGLDPIMLIGFRARVRRTGSIFVAESQSSVS